jgi:uncharacterized repeat protein (TIGR01451 family)
MVAAFAAVSFAQSHSPIPAPGHVFQRAAPGQTPRDVAKANSAKFAALRVHADTAAIPAMPLNLGPHGTITYTCDPNIDTTQAGTCNYLNTTIANLYATAFTNANANIYIKFGITGLGGSTTGFLNLVSYSTYLSALQSHSSGDLVDVSALASLPNSEPSGFNGGQIEVTSALGTALGLSGMTGTTSGGSSCSIGSSGCYNGIITVTTPANLATEEPGQTLYFRQNGGTQGSDAYDFYSVVEHETDEVLGTSSCISTGSPTHVLQFGCGTNNASAVDLFRYSGPSTRVVVSTTPGAYFSYDGGTTNVAVYNTLANGNDYADFITNCQHIQDAQGCLGTGFDINNDGDVEIPILDAVGYNASPLVPVITKTFSPAAIPVLGHSTLTITILNPNNFTTDLNGVGFTDSLPAGMVVASPPNLANACGGTISGATAGSSAFSLTGATLLAGTSGTSPGTTCTVTLNVTGTAAGIWTNTTSAVTSTEAGNGNTGSATLTVLGPPSISKVFTPASIPLGTNSSLSFTITNPNPAALNNVSFTDVLPSGVMVFSAGGATCNGTSVLATSGSGTISLSGASLGASSNCTFAVTVTGTTAGSKTNVTGNVSAAIAGAGNQASANLLVVAPPSITKAFTPNKFIPGGSTTLSFQITNPNAVGLTGIGFTDTLPSGLLVATPSQLTNTCHGTAVATAGTSLVSLSGGTLIANGSCTVSLKVTAPEGIYNNVTSAVTSVEGGNGNTGSATVIVAFPPTIAKNFSAVAIPGGGSATLTFKITNPNQIVSLTGISFVDTLPVGLLVSTPNGLSGSCGGGTIVAVAGSNTISLTGASLAAPGGACTFSVNVTANATGTLVNTTDPITSTQTVTGGTATATIVVGSVFQVSYASNLTVGDSVINLTNTGENGASLYGPGFGGATGNICVNVYALGPDEELLACCSCLITPNALASLSVNTDLVSNTETSIRPTSIVVKTLTTLAGGGGTGTSCTNSAAIVGTLASGMAAWRTTLHALPTGNFDVTEVQLTQATLSSAELASLSGRCTAIIGNSSGAGICNSCRAGGLGAQRDIQ